MKLAQNIKEKIKQLIDSPHLPDPLLRKVASDLQVLPIFTESGGWFGLNLNGDVISASWDAPYQVRVEYDPRIQNLALYNGLKNYPELSELMPVRSAEDVTCPNCNGTGIHPLSEIGIGCYCGGLGWLPNKSPQQ